MLILYNRKIIKKINSFISGLRLVGRYLINTT